MRVMMFGLFFLVVIGSQAGARPRDDVMINAYRCAGHASTRVWLDCYYGAAQPQRAALGLAGAPPAQLQLSRAPIPQGVPQDVAVRDAVIAAAARCASIAPERAWLACYYAAANPARERLGLAPSPGGVPAPPPSPVVAGAPPARGNAGMLDGIFGTRAVVSASRMATYNFDRNGLFTVQLENGEVWQQLDGDGNVAHWSKAPRSYAVTIISGALKSFSMVVKGNPTSYKVRRLS